jgi:uncharacterized protein
MSQTIVDGFAFCRHGEQREGSTAVAELPRLAAEALTGEVSLVCQRCLLPMPHPIDTRTKLVLAHDEPEADATEQALDDDAIDVIVAGTALDLLQLVEDEALLSVPLSPRHPVCPDGGPAAAPDKPDSPFAVLQKLKK